MGENPDTIDASNHFIVSEGAYRGLANYSTIYVSSRSKLLTNPCAPSPKSRDPAIQRAQETGKPRTSLERKADAFDEQGMVGLFEAKPRWKIQEMGTSIYL